MSMTKKLVSFRGSLLRGIRRCSRWSICSRSIVAGGVNLNRSRGRCGLMSNSGKDPVKSSRERMIKCSEKTSSRHHRLQRRTKRSRINN
jgi:hypothetical protein